MPLPDPKLDDRTFQDIVNEAKRLIPRYCPEWTDHNLSDPGVTLIELFAWMTDLILYRLNRVPEKNYLRFMELLGMQLKEPVPARALITFGLSAPQSGPVTIPRNAELATLSTGDEDPITFATDDDTVIWPPTLTYCLASSDQTNYTDLFGRLTTDGDFFEAFQRVPLPGDALYFGFPENLGHHIVSLLIDCNVEGIGVDPRDPPLSWEAWCGNVRGWVRAGIEVDETGGLNTDGSVVLLLPPDMEPRTIQRQTAYWLRVRVLQPKPRQPTYSASPTINTIVPSSLGGNAWATHSSSITGEILGRAGGVPGESLVLQNAPVLPRLPDEFIEIQDDEGEWVRWQEVPSFQNSGRDDHHYTLDGVSGTVSFGPTMRQSDGVEVAYGATPKQGEPIRMSRYRIGGGIEGNVGAGTLTVLRSSIPYVSSVTNAEPASGGLDAETIDAARIRAPLALRSQGRAVTAEDYEYLAREASREVARTHCIQTRSDASSVPPGTVELLIVPAVPPDHPRTLQALQPGPALLDAVRAYLDERKLVGTQLAVDGPAWVGVSVDTTVVAHRNASAERVRQLVLDRIVEYLDPLLGGPTGDGWPFGRDLYLSEMQSVVQGVAGVEYAQDVTLYQVDIQTGQTRAAGQRIIINEDVLFLSYEHIVTVAPR